MIPPASWRVAGAFWTALAIDRGPECCWLVRDSDGREVDEVSVESFCLVDDLIESLNGPGNRGARSRMVAEAGNLTGSIRAGDPPCLAS